MIFNKLHLQLFYFFDKILLVIIMANIFNDLSKEQIIELYRLLGVHNYKFDKGQEILPTIKRENIIGVIKSGYAQIIHVEYNGNEIMTEELYENSIFGTNISGTNDENTQIIAKDNTEVLVIDYNKINNIKNLQYDYFIVFYRNLFDVINSKLKERNERIQVLEKKQIRDKLLEYFEIQHKRNRSKNIYLPFSLKDLADYIGVNRSAMFRELKNMKEENFISVKGRKITLSYKDRMM